MLNRLGLTLAFLWASLNGIGFLILGNGSPARENVLWPLIAEIFSLEYALFFGFVRVVTLAAEVAAGCLAVYGIFLVVALIMRIIEWVKARRSQKSDSNFPEEMPASHASGPETAQVMAVPKVDPMPYCSPPTPVPPKPTAQELKEKAIKQILGR